MTLITHLWNKDYHVVVADGRISGTVENVVTPVCEVYPKIIAFKNGFVAMTANHWGFGDNEPLRDHIIRINPTDSITDAREMADRIFNSIRNKDPEIDAKIYVVKFDDESNVVYIINTLAGIQKVCEYHFSFNGDTNHISLIDVFQNLVRQIYQNPLLDLNFNPLFDSEKIKLLISNLYRIVATQNISVNQQYQIGILTNNSFRWI